MVDCVDVDELAYAEYLAERRGGVGRVRSSDEWEPSVPSWESDPEDDGGASAWAADTAVAVASGSDRQAGTADGASPRTVTRGVKSQSGVDWITVTGKRELLEWILEYGKLRWGDAVLGVGGDFYRQGWRFESGAKVLFDGFTSSNAPTLCLKIQGSVLSAVDADERMEWLRDLMTAGMKCTRLDVALDFQDVKGVGLIEAVYEACERGELTGARRYEQRRPKSGRRLTGNSVYLGRRGKHGSGRLIRVYDKGLQQKERPMGEWERWEVEFSGECAQEVALALCAAEDWAPIAFSRALGSVDFRKATGRRELKRRPRAEWWCDFVNEQLDGGQVVRTRAPARAVNAEATLKWLQKTAGPNLQLYLEATEQTYDEFAEKMAAGNERKRDVIQSLRPWLWELQQEQDRQGRAASKRLGLPF